MSAVQHLRAIAGGHSPADDGLLGNSRCAWGRGEIIGDEAILAAFCAQPLCVENTLEIDTTQGAALIGEEDALIADTYDGRIGRLWRVGRGVGCPHGPAVDVAFDTDMSQTRADIYFRAEDHPALAAVATEPILSAVRDHLDLIRRAGALRVRAFIVRAFGTRNASAALLAIYSMSNESRRSVSFGYAIVGVGAQGAPRVVGEQAPPRSWTPRL